MCLPMQETQETWVRSLGQEDPLEKGMATHPSILAGEIPWKEEAGKELDMTQRLSTNTHTHIPHVCAVSASTHAINIRLLLYMEAQGLL